MLMFIFGLTLCAAMIFAWFYYFSPKRKSRIEKPKYDILDDDKEDKNNKK